MRGCRGGRGSRSLTGRSRPSARPASRHPHEETLSNHVAHPPIDHYRRLIGLEAAEMFLDMQARMPRYREVAAIEVEQLSDRVIRGRQLWVNVTTVSVSGGPPAQSACSTSTLRFVVLDQNHRQLHSFGIDWEVADHALELAHLGHTAMQVPVPGFTIRQQERDGRLLRGDGQLVTISLLTFDNTSDSEWFSNGAALRFGVTDLRGRRSNFTIDWPLAITVINAAHPDHG
jgi:hypothetical protein